MAGQTGFTIANQFSVKGQARAKDSTPGKFVTDYIGREGASERMPAGDGTDELDGVFFGKVPGDPVPRLSLSGPEARAAAKRMQAAFDSGLPVMKVAVSFADGYLADHGVLDRDGLGPVRQGAYRGKLDNATLRQALAASAEAAATSFDGLDWVGCVHVDTANVHGHLVMAQEGEPKVHQRSEDVVKADLTAPELARMRRALESSLDAQKGAAPVSPALQATVEAAKEAEPEEVDEDAFDRQPEWHGGSLAGQRKAAERAQRRARTMAAASTSPEESSFWDTEARHQGLLLMRAKGLMWWEEEEEEGDGTEVAPEELEAAGLEDRLGAAPMDAPYAVRAAFVDESRARHGALELLTEEALASVDDATLASVRRAKAVADLVAELKAFPSDAQADDRVAALWPEEPTTEEGTKAAAGPSQSDHGDIGQGTDKLAEETAKRKAPAVPEPQKEEPKEPKAAPKKAQERSVVWDLDI